MALPVSILQIYIGPLTCGQESAVGPTAVRYRFKQNACGLIGHEIIVTVFPNSADSGRAVVSYYVKVCAQSTGNSFRGLSLSRKKSVVKILKEIIATDIGVLSLHFILHMLASIATCF